MKKMILAAAFSMTAIAAPASAQNLLTNGSFENGSFSGWSLSPTGPDGSAAVVFAYDSTPPGNPYPGGAYGEAIPPSNVASASPDPVGDFVAYFSSDNANPETLSQTINLVAGQLYKLGFDYYVPQNGFGNPFDATLNFRIGSDVVSSLTTGSINSNTLPVTWYNFSTSFVAQSTGPQTLSFDFFGGGVTAADFAIDRVYAIAAVPEPAAWGMMLLGFGLVGGALRRRRQSVRVSFA